MKNPRILPYLLLVGLLSAMVFSCASFPQEQLTLNLANEIPPVTLNEVAKPAHARNFTYEAGYKSQSMSAATRGGGTITMTMSGNQNMPLGTQMQTLFINNPEWAAITSLVFSVDLSNVLGVLSTTSYTLRTDAEVPFQK